ncbi:hypothetical protein ACFWGC_27620 [Cytobacillus pseudoceanisediminis]|uniref:hypothetical protein n=1 Tax=Cytobacillus TaxID=2675230 RepID=UPI001114E6CB|nr:hypothetical protein [Cytobacillus oceanisediminis]
MKRVLLIMLAIIISPPISSFLVVLAYSLLDGVYTSFFSQVYYLAAFEYIFLFFIGFPFTLVVNFSVKICNIKKPLINYLLKLSLYLIPILWLSIDSPLSFNPKSLFEYGLSFYTFLHILIYLEKKTIRNN